MGLIEVFNRFPDHEACIAHLEAVRWGDCPACPHCGSLRVGRKADGARVGRWNCHDCHGSFNVLHGTIFQKTKIPLQKWFLAIGLLLNAKKSISSCQLARDLELNQKSAWFLAMRVRMELAKDANAGLLHGIVEADECYIGGKPRKANRRIVSTHTHSKIKARIDRQGAAVAPTSSRSLALLNAGAASLPALLPSPRSTRPA